MEGSKYPSFDPSRLTKATAEDYSSSASESEEERFLPGEDFDNNEFGDSNPRKRRRLGRNNKERAALGIFGSDSEDDGPASRWKRKTLRNRGMNFVTTDSKKDSDGDTAEESDLDGHQPLLGSGRRNENDEDDGDSDDDSDNDGSSGGVGLGFSVASKQHGWHNGAPETDQISSRSSKSAKIKTTFKGGGILGVGFVPSSATEPVLSESAKEAPEPPRNKPQKSAFTSRGKINATSFGARMMAKMGYVEGQGLGAEGQGRNIIIEANLRPQGIGLGAVKEKTEQERLEEKRQARLRGEVVIDSDEEKKKKKAKVKRQGIGHAYSSAGSTPRRQKPRYLTADEIKAAAPGLHIPEAFTPILDMTGPGGRLLTSASGIMTPVTGEAEPTETAEARKLVKRAQAELLAFSEEWRSLEERQTWLDLGIRERQQEVDDLQSDLAKLSVFSTLVSERLVTATTWEEVTDALRQVVDHGSMSSEVIDLVVAAIHPFFRDWDPLTDPSRFAKELNGLSGFLLNGDNQQHDLDKWKTSPNVANDGVFRRHHKATTTYETMMYKSWLPQVLSAVRIWDAFDPTRLLEVMEHWNDLLPPFVRSQLMENVARKLDGALSGWNPKLKGQSSNLPHTWLFPWLQYLPPYHLDPKGTGLVADVKRKFRHLIDSWEYERGLIPGLTQWEEVLGNQWRPLMMSHVLPSMGKYLRRNFQVDPADQEPSLPVLLGVLKWSHVLGKSVIAEVLTQHLFPMWGEKLQEWMVLDEVDFSEVADWYTWWRGFVLKDLDETNGVGRELDNALVMMNTV